jgi:hypothetical protein
MTRRELVDATYDAAERLNELKVQHGRISPRRGRAVARGIAAARALRAQLDEQMAQGRGTGTDAALLGEISRFSISTVCDKRELFWPRRLFNFKVAEIARILGRYLSGRSASAVAREET